MTNDRDTNPDTEEFNEIDTPEEAEALVAEETEAGEKVINKFLIKNYEPTS